MPSVETYIEDTVQVIRTAIEEQVQDAKIFLTSLKVPADDSAAIPLGELEDRGEVIENVTLALRHLEDARMRLGKVYQARNGGVSNSDR